MQNNDSVKINRRFFKALRLLKAHRAIRGIKTFTDRYGINRRNMATCEKEPHRGLFQLAWLTYIVRDYGVSARWLVLGEGDIFTNGKPMVREATPKTKPQPQPADGQEAETMQS